MKAFEKLIGKKVVVRSDCAGVFFGTLNEAEQSSDKLTVELINCRRLWYWDGACSISQIAIDGTKKPSECKFTQSVSSIVVSNVIEIIPATKTSIQSIEKVTEWKR